jgi:pimeloyl-ACP methyl ester carboxylesterase
MSGRVLFQSPVVVGTHHSFSRHVSQTARYSRRIITRASSDDLDEVDPITGEIITGTSRARVASSRVTTDKWTHAYREAEVPDGVEKQSIEVMCLHGIGSSSYAFRKTINLLAGEGISARALDWIGHGTSDHPPKDSFSYSIDGYVDELDDVMNALGYGPDNPVVLIAHGYILGQAALLYAASHTDVVSKVVTLNVPLGLKTKLRPELAQYKNPIAFLKPKEDSVFKGDLFNAAGGPYALGRDDADAYNEPYVSSTNASAAIWNTMDQVDWESLKKRVNEAMRQFKKPVLCIHGNSDTFVDLSSTLDWLEDKPTSTKMAYGIEAKLGHSPQEDYPEAIHPVILDFIRST